MTTPVAMLADSTDGLLAITVGLFAVAAGVGLIWLIHVMIRDYSRLARQKRFCCINCGYDLRRAAEECPECGWPMHYALPPDDAVLDITALREYWPEHELKPPTVTGSERLMPVYATFEEWEAHAVEDFINAHGYIAEVQTFETERSLLGETKRVTKYHVVVEEEEQDWIRTLLARHSRVPHGDRRPASEG